MTAHETSPPDTPGILIVEDNPINMELVRDILQAYGFRVREAADGPSCLQAVQDEIPDLILMDVQLPGMDGFAVTRRIKTHDAWRHVPVVALTAYAMKGDREKALSAGCSGVITKPIDTRAFAKQVETYLKGFSETLEDT